MPGRAACLYRREHAEAGAGKGRARAAALWRTAALLHARDVRCATVEFVVPDTVEIEPGKIQRLDGGLFV